MPSTLPEELASLRAQRGLSKSGLAIEADLDPSAVNRLENGVRAPRMETLELLANALELSELQRARLYASAGFLPEGWVAAKP